MFPETLAVIRDLAAAWVKQYVVFDANSVLTTEFLRHHGLEHAMQVHQPRAL